MTFGATNLGNCRIFIHVNAIHHTATRHVYMPVLMNRENVVQYMCINKYIVGLSIHVHVHVCFPNRRFYTDIFSDLFVIELWLESEKCIGVILTVIQRLVLACPTEAPVAKGPYTASSPLAAWPPHLLLAPPCFSPPLVAGGTLTPLRSRPKTRQTTVKERRPRTKMARAKDWRSSVAERRSVSPDMM